MSMLSVAFQKLFNRSLSSTASLIFITAKHKILELGCPQLEPIITSSKKKWNDIVQAIVKIDLPLSDKYEVPLDKFITDTGVSLWNKIESGLRLFSKVCESLPKKELTKEVNKKL